MASPFLILWCCSRSLCQWLNRPVPTGKTGISDQDEVFLRGAALRTWRFFRQFSNPETNWLIPDTVQETAVLAHRVSPTNLGLLLNARAAAYDLGYLTLADFVTQTEKTFSAMQRLPRFNGHFLNWYDTRTLSPLEPLFISSVDSGNLACSLWTLKNGCLEMSRQPLFDPGLWPGIRGHLEIIDQLLGEAPAPRAVLSAIKRLKSRLQGLGDDTLGWLVAIPRLEREIRNLIKAASNERDADLQWWTGELAARIRSLDLMAGDLTPWLLPEYLELCRHPEIHFEIKLGDLTLESVPFIFADLDSKLWKLQNKTTDREIKSSLRSFRALLSMSLQKAVNLAGRLSRLAATADALVQEMDFRFLYNSRRRLLSIGYDVKARQLNPSCYDLLASEARAAAFIAIAKGEIPQESWFHLGRAHTVYQGERVLLSWNGTMFEYLLPGLWMKSYPNTILERNVRASVRCQQKLGRIKHVPWGTSEAAYSERDEAECRVWL